MNVQEQHGTVAVVDYGRQYRDFIKHRIDQLTEHLTAGRIEGFEEYRFVTGQLAAFKEALREFDDSREAEKRDEGGE